MRFFSVVSNKIQLEKIEEMKWKQVRISRAMIMNLVYQVYEK